MSDREAHKPASQGQDASLSDLRVAKLTDVGRLRPHNEDYVDYYLPSDPRQREIKGDLFLIADGMGGHQAGEVASRKAVEAVRAQYYGDPNPDSAVSLVRAVRIANEQVYGQAQADPTKVGMGTTLVAAVIKGRKVYLANVGDSRAYVINAKGISQITEDHSWVEEQVRAGLLSPEQAARHPQRNLLTRALGSKPSVEVDLFEGELHEGDALLLCTDGLTGRVEDAEIAAIVQGHSLEEAAHLLVAQANERGGNDNISVLIVGGTKFPAAAPSGLAAAGKKPGRPFSLVPILAGTVGLLVLALLAFLFLPSLPGIKPTATPTVTSSPTASPETVGPTETPALLPTVTLAISPIETPMPMPTETPTETPTATNTPTETPTGTPTPTNTSTPTGTPTPTATSTPTHTPQTPVSGVGPPPILSQMPPPTATP